LSEFLYVDEQKEMNAMRAMSEAAGTVAERRTSRTRVMIGVTLVLLLAQFLLGMYVNLFVPTPGRQPVLFAHIVLGTLLLVVALVTTVVAVAGRRPVTAVLSAAGLVFLVMAWIAGARFLGGGGHNADSYLIATGFVLTASSYVVALDRGRRGDA
jgi:Na+/melibiose symporter-like transporter